MTEKRRFLHTGGRAAARWLALLTLVTMIGCTPPAPPEPSATPIPPTETPPPPTATPTSSNTPAPMDEPTTVPTPTLTPTLEPTPSADPLVPKGEITPPAPGFEPTPPPPPDPAASDAEAWVREYVGLVTAMLNSGASVEAVLDTLLAWSSSPDNPGGDPSTVTWAESADMDGDGAAEWLMSLPVPGRGCGATFCPAYVVIFDVEEGLFKPRYVVRSAAAPEVQMQLPSLRRIDDINGDGEAEVLIQQRWCGAHTCVTGLTVGRWDGTRWHDLAADRISQAYADLTIEDRDGDGALEFTMHGGIFGSVGAGLQRQHTLIFAWEEGAYRLVGDTPDPSDHPYYLMLDANTALAEGNWDRALGLASKAVNNPNFEETMAPVEEVDRRRIISYAAVEAMLVHAHRGNVAQMEAVLDRARSYDFVQPNVYTEAAERLLQVYQDTGDAIAACTAMEEVVARQPDQAVFFQWYGYNTARITVDQVCPLDSPTQGESPQL